MGKTPSKTQRFAFCEPSWATTRSHRHLRIVGDEGLRLTGGVPVPALCGMDLASGWDLPDEVTSAAVRADAELAGGPGRLHRVCALRYFDRTRHAVGTCATCGRVGLAIRKDGTVWHHTDPSKGDRAVLSTRCTGSGEPPREANAAP